MSSLFEILPSNCIDIIANYVLHFTPDCDHHIIAANCCLVGNKIFRELASTLWEKIEPGCIKSAHKDFEKTS